MPNFSPILDVTLAKGSLEYQRMIPIWNQLYSIYRGSIVIDSNKASYLVQYSSEENSDFQKRQESSVFQNFYQKSIRDISDLPFAEEIKVPENFNNFDFADSFLQDVDGRGSNLTYFFKKAFEMGLALGVCGILVDYPSFEGEPSTSDRSNRQPTFKLFLPQCIKGAFGFYREGKFVLERVWLESIESSLVESEGGRVESERRTITEFLLVATNRVQMKVFAIDSSNQSETLIEERMLNISKIPFQLFKISETDEGVLAVTPPLYDLAQLNLSHYQKSSDQNNILKISRYPRWFASGFSGEQELENLRVTSPNSIVASSNPNAKYVAVEIGGTSIQAGERDLATLKEDMRNLALEFQNRSNVSPTATEIAVNEARSGSMVRSIAIKMDSLINSLIDIALEYRGETLEDENGFEIFKKFSIDAQVTNKSNILLGLRARGDLSLETFLNRMVDFELLPRELRVEEELERIREESLTGLINEPSEPEPEEETEDGDQ